jgi:hypothetical protein
MSRLGVMAALAVAWSAAAQEVSVPVHAPAIEASQPPSKEGELVAPPPTPPPPPEEILIVLPPKPKKEPLPHEQAGLPPPPPGYRWQILEPAPSFQEVHPPRPRYEPWQIAMELGGASAAVLLGSAAVFAVDLIPIALAYVFNVPEIANAFLYIFSLVGGITVPLVSTITIEKLKVFSPHYKLDGLGWWITYGSGFLLQMISTVITFAVLDINNYIGAPHLIVFTILTPLVQTAAANVFPTPRDPLAPLGPTWAVEVGLQLVPERGGGFAPAVTLGSFRF